MSGACEPDSEGDFDEDDRLAADYDASSVDDVHPFLALTVVSACWLVVFFAIFGLAEVGRWVLSAFGF